MAPYLDPSSRPDPEREGRQRATAGHVELRPQRRSALLGTRSLACPGCEMPLGISAPLGWNDLVECPFCDGVAPTRDFIREHGWPEVELVARFL